MEVLNTFKVTADHWKALGDRTRAHKVSGTLRNAWGRAWCVEKGVQPTTEGMTKAFDTGILSWEAVVVECIGYDVNLVQQLSRGF